MEEISHTLDHIFSLKKNKKKGSEDITSGEEGADHETEADSSHSKYKEKDED